MKSLKYMGLGLVLVLNLCFSGCGEGGGSSSEAIPVVAVFDTASVAYNDYREAIGTKGVYDLTPGCETGFGDEATFIIYEDGSVRARYYFNKEVFSYCQVKVFYQYIYPSNEALYVEQQDTAGPFYTGMILYYDYTTETYYEVEMVHDSEKQLHPDAWLIGVNHDGTLALMQDRDTGEEFSTKLLRAYK